MRERPAIVWPVKTREIISHYLDSRAWNEFAFRDGDIVIATYAKSGTTWTQQILSELIYGGAENINVHELSPWIELRILPPELRLALDQQTHRRFLKTHLPVDALVMSPKARYIYLARDGRDVAWSFHNHHYNATDDYFHNYNAGRPAHLPPLERGLADPHAFYRQWFDRDGYPIWPFWHHIRSWWAIRSLPNVLLIHFNDLKDDLEGTIRRIAAFLEIPVERASFSRVVEHCSFDYMKAHATKVAPRGGEFWNGGAATFINKGSNGRWRDALNEAEISEYEARALNELGPACAKWLANGGAIPS